MGRVVEQRQHAVGVVEGANRTARRARRAHSPRRAQGSFERSVEVVLANCEEVQQVRVARDTRRVGSFGDRAHSGRAPARFCTHRGGESREAAPPDDPPLRRGGAHHSRGEVTMLVATPAALGGEQIVRAVNLPRAERRQRVSSGETPCDPTAGGCLGRRTSARASGTRRGEKDTPRSFAPRAPRRQRRGREEGAKPEG